MRWVVVVVGLAVALVGCGGGDDAGVATLRDDASTTAPQTDVDVEAALLEFVQCVRDEGIDIDDPQFDDGGVLRLDPDALPEDVDPDELLAARDACSEYLEGVTLRSLGFDFVDLQDRLVTYAACMRSNGYDLPDPDLTGFLSRVLGSGRQNSEGAEGFGPFGDVDPTDPDFLAADDVCRPLAFTGLDLPGPGEGPFGGG